MRSLKIIIILILIPTYSFSVMFSEIKTTENSIRMLSNTSRVFKNEAIYNSLQYSNYLINKSYVNNFNKYKGNLAENIMDQFFVKDDWKRVIPSLNNNGFDGLYIKYKNGIPVDMIVSESKYGSSKLGNTSNGKQMSPNWIKNNINKMKEEFSKIQFDPNIDINKANDSFDLFLSNGKKVKVYKINNNLYIKDTKNVELAKKSINNHVKFFDEIEKGNMNYKRRLFNLRFEKNNEINLKIYDMDNNKVTLLKKENFDTLPVSNKNAIKNGLIKNDAVELMKKGYNKNSAYNEATKRFENRLRKNELYKYESLKTYKINPILADALKIGISSIGISLAEELLINYITKEKINWERVAFRTGGIGFVETSIMMFSKYIKNLSFMKSSLLMLVGITAVDLILSGIHGDLDREILLNSSISLAGTVGITVLTPLAVKHILMGIASVFGTASTGVPIKFLSGAAATNAKLAWLGGGALSAGGGGMAAGAALISRVTLGIVSVGLLGYMGYKYINERQTEELIRKDKMQYLINKYN